MTTFTRIISLDADIVPARILERRRRSSRPTRREFAIGYIRANDLWRLLSDTIHAAASTTRRTPRRSSQTDPAASSRSVCLGEVTGRLYRRGSRSLAHEADGIDHGDRSDTMIMAESTTTVVIPTRVVGVVWTSATVGQAGRTGICAGIRRFYSPFAWVNGRRSPLGTTRGPTRDV